MLRVFQNDILDPKRFVITMELVPGREPAGRSVDSIKGMAADAFADGRVSAVSITDNPGGNPALSPDVIGHDIFKVGMDVIVHFTCRDANRIGMESRALQLAMMGMKNILALTGDYIGKGFAGQGAPVFDLDSVTLLVMLRMLGKRVQQAGDPDVFFAGCAVSPFKSRRGEAFAQYAKLCRKVAAGARFAITQLGYDAGRYKELLDVQRRFGLDLPTLGSVYVLTPVSARIMNAGQVPGAVVSDELLNKVIREWRDKMQGRALAVERAARLGAVLKGLGYRGIHIAGVHRGFELAGRILDRMAQIEDQWRDFLDDFAPGKSRDGCPGEKRNRSGQRRVPAARTFRFRTRCTSVFSRLSTISSLISMRRWPRSFDRWLAGSAAGPPAGFWCNCLRTRLKPFCSNAGAAEIALSSTWRFFVPSPSARNTSATAPAAAVETGAVRCFPSGSAFGSGPGSVGPMGDTRRRWSPTASRRGCGNWMALRPG